MRPRSSANWAGGSANWSTTLFTSAFHPGPCENCSNGIFSPAIGKVLVTTKKGKHYLIGSDNPEALAAAITAAIAAGQA
jgi:deoxycytidylate deaminase